MASQDTPKAPPKTPWPDETGLWATYTLHCHCGAIRFTITLSPPLFPSPDSSSSSPHDQTIYPVTACTCSHCARNGILSVHPLSKNVHWTRGLEDRAEYRCGRGENPHWFCRKCGSAIGTDLSGLMGKMGMEGRATVNVRNLKDFDEKKLSIVTSEVMKDMPPKYEIGD